MTQVLVLDGAQRSALAVARSLGRRGIDVVVAESRLPCLAGASRHARAQLACPNAQTHPTQFTHWVRDTCLRMRIEYVFPLTDVSTMLLAPLVGAWGNCKMIGAPADIYERVTDKQKLVSLAAPIGVQVPQTIATYSVEQIESQLESFAYPVVMKPGRSRVLLGDRVISTAVHIAHDRKDAIAYARAQSWLGAVPCLLQEYIAGYGCGVFALYADGRPLAWFAHRRIREKPPRGGVSVLSESVVVDPVLRTPAERLLNAAKWDGAAMVEFRMSHAGVPYLMEVNGRLWGSLQLAIDSGIDFPWLMLQAARGRLESPAATYMASRRLRWFLGDVDNLLLEVRGKGLSTTLFQRLHAIFRFLATSVDPRARNEVLRLTDFKPAILEARRWVRSVGRA